MTEVHEPERIDQSFVEPQTLSQIMWRAIAKAVVAAALTEVVKILVEDTAKKK